VLTPDQQLQLETLHRIAIDDLLACLKIEKIRPLCWLLERLCWSSARRFARQVATYDQIIGEAGLRAAAAWIVTHFAHGMQVEGLSHVPASGPLLLLANHPGMTDAPAIFASLPRSDVHIVAAPHLLFRTLPHMSRYLLYVSEDSHKRLAVVRNVIRQLHAGGTVLLFPRGALEPDPAMFPGAIQALADWSESIAVFIRQVPQAWVLPVLVRGVRSAASFHNPLTRLYRAQSDRERVAAVLQVLFPQYQNVTIHVTYGMPVRAAALAQHGDAKAIARAVTKQMAQLIEAQRL
jgi:1-acyl-sn-glycerol-3-phosphate acyltransferase